MCSIRWCCVWSLLGFWAGTGLDAGEPKGTLARYAQSRNWSDQSGQFQIPARMKFGDEQKVELEKDDGLVVTVPLDRLSRADQAFVREFLQAEKAAAAENPFAGGVPSGRGPSGPSEPSNPFEVPSAPPEGTLRKVNAVIKGARPLSITPSRAFWSVERVIPLPALSVQDTILTSDLAKPFFAAMRVGAAGRNGTIILNAYQQGRGGRQENYGRFAVLDATTQDVSSVFEYDQPWKLMAISPDASLIAAVRVEGFDKGNDVAIFRIAGGEVVPQFQFTAGGGSWDELHWVAFLPGHRLGTISQKHDLTFWDLRAQGGPRALYRGSTGGALTAALTPAGDLMAYPVGSSIAVVETGTGKLVGCITREVKAEQLAFAPGGKYLAAFHPFTLTLYSLADGTEVKTIAVGESNANAALQWCGEHLLIGNVLYDVERGVPMWTYEGRSAARTTHGNLLISAFGSDKGSTVTVFQLPHDEALRAAAGVDPSTIYAITPGHSISIEYNLGAVPPNVQQQVRQIVETKVQQLGWKVAPQAPHKMQVSMVQGNPEQVEYFTRTGFGPFFGPPPGFGGPRPSGPSEKVQFRPWTHTLTVTSQGQTLFHNQYVRTAPDNLQTKDGETTQAAVTRFVQPVPEHFGNIAIPPSVLKPEYQGGLGKSSLTESGFR